MSTATFGTANHPFRATLPLRVLRRLPQFEPEVRARIAEVERAEAALAEAVRAEAARARATGKPSAWRLSAQDLRDFLLAYIACFMAVSAWLA